MSASFDRSYVSQKSSVTFQVLYLQFMIYNFPLKMCFSVFVSLLTSLISEIYRLKAQESLSLRRSKDVFLCSAFPAKSIKI